jgi:hypothetical protein
MDIMIDIDKNIAEGTFSDKLNINDIIHIQFINYNIFN